MDSASAVKKHKALGKVKREVSFCTPSVRKFWIRICIITVVLDVDGYPLQHYIGSTSHYVGLWKHDHSIRCAPDV